MKKNNYIKYIGKTIGDLTIDILALIKMFVDASQATNEEASK